MNVALLLAAGESKRFGSDKLFAPALSGKPVIYHSLKFLEDSSRVDAIFIAANTKNKGKIATLVKSENFKKVKKILNGGQSRYESVRKLLSPVHHLSRAAFFIIHNAANPFATGKELEQCVRFLKKNPSISGVAPGRPHAGTVKKVGAKNYITETISRHNIWTMETPQVVRAKDFIAACKKNPQGKAKFDFTDDLSLLEAAGFKTAAIKASPYNRKITDPADLPVPYRMGIGEDSHKFKDQRSKIKDQKESLILGGITIKTLPALDAQSDGDVILHALCNAISSALGKGSLGSFATKMAHRGVKNSTAYLKKTLQEMKRRHFQINNCAISLEALRPKIDPLVPSLKKSLKKLLSLSEENIGITATSGEKLTPFGKGEAVRCLACVLLQSSLS